MPRPLETNVLAARAQHYASHWLRPSVRSTKPSRRWISGRDYVLQDLQALTFKDEFAAVVGVIKDCLGGRALAQLEAALKSFPVRDDGAFRDLLAKKLAIDPEGRHLPGVIGCTVVGGRIVGRRVTRHGVKPAVWPVYAGEEEERAAGNVRPRGERAKPSEATQLRRRADPLPPPDTQFPDETTHMGYSLLMAEVSNISIAMAITGLDAKLALLDEGTGNGVFKGYTTPMPDDPDEAISAQTLLFTLGLSATAFGGATDQAPNARADAAAIADDAAADATGTLAWCRGSSSNDGATALNDHIDGNAATSAAAHVFNTTAIVDGATVSMISWSVTEPQGPTAS